MRRLLLCLHRVLLGMDGVCMRVALECELVVQRARRDGVAAWPEDIYISPEEIWAGRYIRGECILAVDG